MRPAFLFSFLLCGAGSCLAQAPASPAPQAAESQEQQGTPQVARPDQRIERIRHEDDGARIDELRVGGETRNITVQPKGGLPAYEITPDNANQQPGKTDHESASGQRGWKLFNF